MFGFLFKRSPTVDERLETHWKILLMRGYSDQTIRLKRHYSRIFSAQFGNRRIDKINRIELKQWLLERAENTPSHTRCVLIFIRDFYTEAMIDGVIEHSPAEYIKLPTVEVRRKRLTEDEFLRTYARVPENHFFRRALELAITTGQRRADIEKMSAEHVWGGYLHIIQHKGQKKHPKRIALPLSLKSPLLDKNLGEIIEQCLRESQGKTLLQNKHKKPVSRSQLSVLFQDYRDNPDKIGEPSFHEIRSLAERTYKKIGIDTQTLLGHKHQKMTDIYNDTRGLPEYKKLIL